MFLFSQKSKSRNIMRTPGEIYERIGRLEKLIKINETTINSNDLSRNSRDEIESDSRELQTRIGILKWVLNEK
jgi:hypothetical protein